MTDPPQQIPPAKRRRSPEHEQDDESEGKPVEQGAVCLLKDRIQKFAQAQGNDENDDRAHHRQHEGAC